MQGAQRETPVHVSSWDSSGPRAALFHPRLSDGVSVPCLSPVMMCPDLAKTGGGGGDNDGDDNLLTFCKGDYFASGSKPTVKCVTCMLGFPSC